MYGYIYKTKNKITGTLYIGQKTSNVFVNNYFGSGKQIKQDLKTYGKRNFTVKLLAEATSKNELDDLERKIIKKYKTRYKSRCINQSIGGQNGGNVFMYADDDTKKIFNDKMKSINKKRCNTDEFKAKASKRMTEKYLDKAEREIQSKKIKKSWSNKDLRLKQSDTLKEYYKTHKHDCSFNNKQCLLMIGMVGLKFDSVKSLKKYIERVYDVHLGNPVIAELLRTETPYHPYYKKEKFLKLDGMVLKYV